MQSPDMISKFLTKPPVSTSRKEFVQFLKETQEKGEISWLITDARSFEWTEINQQKSKFLKQMTELKFKNACVGVFHPESKSTEYTSFVLKKSS